MGLGRLIRLFVISVNVQSVFNFGLLRMDRRTDRSEAGRMRAGMLDDVVTERVVILIARRDRHLGRSEAHVVPAEILEVSAGLAEPLRAHGRTGGALACEKSGGERSDWLGFAHVDGSH